MRITKKDLKQMILETMTEQEEDPTKLKSGVMSVSQRKKGSLERIKGSEQEFSSAERNIVDQIEKFVSQLAATPGVDLTNYRSILQQTLKSIQRRLSSGAQEKDQQQPPEGEET